VAIYCALIATYGDRNNVRTVISIFIYNTVLEYVFLRIGLSGKDAVKRHHISNQTFAANF